MELIPTSNLIDIFAVCMLLSSVLAMASVRMRPLIRLFILQSFFLAAFEFTVAYSQNEPEIYIMAAMTFGIKVLLIPKMLKYIMSRIKVDDEMALSVGIPGSMLLSAALIIFSYYVAGPDNHSQYRGEELARPLISIMLIGMLMMATRPQGHKQVVDCSWPRPASSAEHIALSNGMPFIVELGILRVFWSPMIIIGIICLQDQQVIQFGRHHPVEEAERGMIATIMVLVPLLAGYCAPSDRNQRPVPHFHRGSQLHPWAAVIYCCASPINGTVINTSVWYIDGLSAFFLLISGFISFVTILYSKDYLRTEWEEGHLNSREMRWFYFTMFVFISTILLTFAVRSAALTWIGIGATTLVSAFLVGMYKDENATEAAWEVRPALLGRYYAGTIRGIPDLRRIFPESSRSKAPSTGRPWSPTPPI
jgi:hydrogenase-4 membrane subunit HyfE